MGNNNAKTSKYVAMITYIVALICLILGLFLPLGNQAAVAGADSIMALQLPKALGALFNNSWGSEKVFTYSYSVNFLGLMTDKSIDIGAVLVLLYTVITAFGVIALIPVIACGRKSRVALKTASFIEVIALLFLASLIFIELTKFSGLGILAGAASDKWSYALLIAFGGTLLMLIVQAFVYRKGSGLIKFILFLLSAAAVLFTMFPVTLIITQLADPINKVVGNGDKIASGLYGMGGLEGITQLVSLFSIKYFEQLKGVGETLQKLLTVSTLVLALLVFINFMCDMMGIGKRTNKGMLVCNVIRYALEVIAVILVFVAILVLKKPEIKIGLMLIVLAVIALLQLIINIIRLCIYRRRRKSARKVKDKKKKKEKKSESAEVYTPSYTAPVYTATATTITEEKAEPENKKASKREEKRAEKEARKAEAAAQAEAEAARKAAEKAAKKAAKEEPVYETPASVATAATATPAPAVTPASTVKKAEAKGQPVYNVEPLYNGPIDDFIRKLNNQERIEFAQVFLERAKCPLKNVPDYVVGGNNSKFFSSVFIYYGRIRDYVSDGLLNKIYEECNLMY